MRRELVRRHAAHIDVFRVRAPDGLPLLGTHHEAELLAEIVAGLGEFRILGPLLERVAVDDRPLRRLPGDGVLLQESEQVVEHLIARANAPRIARVAVVSQLETRCRAGETRDGLNLARRALHAEFQHVIQRLRLVRGRRGDPPLPVVHRVQQAPHFLPSRRLSRIGDDGARLPRALMHPVGRMLRPVAQLHRDRRAGIAILQLEKNVADLREQPVQWQVILLLDPRLHVRLVHRQQNRIDVAARGRLGLRLGDQGHTRTARLQLGERVIAFPHGVLHRAPIPADLRFHPAVKGPHLRLFAPAIRPVQPHLPRLLDANAEPRLEPETRLVPRQHQIPPRLRDLDLDRRLRALALLRRAEKRLPTEKRDRKGRGVIILAPIPRTPPRLLRLAHLKFLRLQQNAPIRQRRHRHRPAIPRRPRRHLLELRRAERHGKQRRRQQTNAPKQA